MEVEVEEVFIAVVLNIADDSLRFTVFLVFFHEEKVLLLFAVLLDLNQVLLFCFFPVADFVRADDLAENSDFVQI